MIQEIVKKKRKPSLRAQLSEKCGEKEPASAASYALRFSKTGARFHINDACHARLKWADNERGVAGNELVEIALNVNSWFSRIIEADKKAYRMYVKYILNDSPWAECFITKQVGAAITHGVLMNVNMHVSALVGAAIALREGWEYQGKLKLFHWCLGEGYSGNTAYLVSGFLQEDVKKKGSFLVTGFHGGHQVLSEFYHTWENWVKFFKKGYSKKGASIRNTKGQSGYSVFSAIRGVYETRFNYEKPGIGDPAGDTLKKLSNVKEKRGAWSSTFTCKLEDVNNMAKSIEEQLKG